MPQALLAALPGMSVWAPLHRADAHLASGIEEKAEACATPRGMGLCLNSFSDMCDVRLSLKYEHDLFSPNFG